MQKSHTKSGDLAEKSISTHKVTPSEPIVDEQKTNQDFVIEYESLESHEDKLLEYKKMCMVEKQLD